MTILFFAKICQLIEFSLTITLKKSMQFDIVTVVFSIVLLFRLAVSEEL